MFGGAAWAERICRLKAPAAPAYYDWTGFYLGGNLGAANGTTSFSDYDCGRCASTFSSSNPASFIGGGQLGVNYEFRSGLVVGAEAMFDWLANAPTTFTASNLTAGTATGTINNRWITMATGKVGFAWDRLLVYGKAGGAWVGGTNNSFDCWRDARRRFRSTPGARAGPQARASNGLRGQLVRARRI